MFIKKRLRVLILFVSIPTLIYSQITYPKILSDSTIIINYQQLKNANKLFIQGEMYKNLYEESYKQNKEYKELIVNYERIDSIRVNDINNLNKLIEKSNNSNKTLSSVNNILTGSVIGLLILSIISFFK